MQHLVEWLRAELVELKEKNVALKRSDVTLRESEERYRCIVQTAQEGVWTIDAGARTNFVNLTMARMLGYTVEEMLGRPLDDFMDEEGRQISASNLDRRRQGIAEQHEFKFRRKDGSDLWTLLATNPITDGDGNYVGALAMVADITERKRSEAALEESEEMFRVLFANAGDGIIIMQGDRAVDCNARALEMLGCEERDQVVGHLAGEFSPRQQPDGRDSQELIAEKISAALAGHSQVFDWTHRKRDGTTFPTEVTLNAVRLRDAVLLQAIVRDVTRRKKAEGALAKTLALLERTGEIAKVGAWELDLRTMERYWSRETCRILEVDSPQASPFEDGTMFFAPEARSTIVEAVKAAVESGAPYDLELPVITAKGRRIWVRAQGSAVWEGGRVVKLLGALHDVSDRKQAEIELARVTDLLERTGELAKVGGWELDLKTKALSWSQETCRIHELDSLVAPSLEQALAFYAPENRPILEAALQAATERGTPYDLELPLVTAKGRHIWVRAQGSSIKSGGRVVKLIGAIQEITDRKHAQIALASSEAALQQANETLQRTNEELELRVARRTNQLRALANELTHAEERVRLKVADSLHEGLSQLLSAALMHLAVLEPHVVHPKAQVRLKDLRYCLDESINVCRTLTYELSPPILQSLGFGAALRWLATWYEEKHGLVVEVFAPKGIDIGERELRITVFRAASELLFNVLKHAQVKRASVRLRRMPRGWIRLEVGDEGLGFDLVEAKAREAASGSFGLFSLRERIEACGGRLEVSSAPGCGSRIAIAVPLPPDPVASDSEAS